LAKRPIHHIKQKRVKALLKRLLSRFGLYLSQGYTVYFFGNNKIVQREIYGKKMLMPRSHSITFNLSRFPYYNSNLQRLVQQYASFRKETFSILDIGANIGDTMLMLRQVTGLPIHCFEGDPFYYRLLENNSKDVPRAFIHNVLLTDKPASLRVKNEIKLGSSQFVTDAEQGRLTDFTSVDLFAAGHFPEEPVGLIKVDTDGYDLKILRGARETLKKHQPVLFFEYDRVLFEQNGDNGPAFLDSLAELNYAGLLAYDNFGKLICRTALSDKETLRILHMYIKDHKSAFPFYDLVVFSRKDDAFVRSFTESELAFFER
jgi:FkbM family methyltransferase